MTAPTRPALRYYGGKYRLAQWIIGHFPPHRCYVEPYAGAASVLLQKPRSYAEVYNDLDGEVVNLFRVLRDPAQARELERQLRLTPYARTEFEQSYQPAGDPIEQARRSIARSFMGFGSASLEETVTGFRDNAKRSGTIPAHDWARYPDQIAAFCQRLTGVVIESRPALEVIERQDAPTTLFYVDPPYPHVTRGRVRAHRYRYEMSDDDHRALAERLHQVNGYAILSGYRCPLYAELYQDWRTAERETHADGALDRTEILWLSPRTWQALQAGAGLPLFTQGVQP
jgi:DNA adenine methylase